MKKLLPQSLIVIAGMIVISVSVGFAILWRQTDPQKAEVIPAHKSTASPALARLTFKEEERKQTTEPTQTTTAATSSTPPAASTPKPKATAPRQFTGTLYFSPSSLSRSFEMHDDTSPFSVTITTSDGKPVQFPHITTTPYAGYGLTVPTGSYAPGSLKSTWNMNINLDDPDIGTTKLCIAAERYEGRDTYTYTGCINITLTI